MAVEAQLQKGQVERFEQGMQNARDIEQARQLEKEAQQSLQRAKETQEEARKNLDQAREVRDRAGETYQKAKEGLDTLEGRCSNLKKDLVEAQGALSSRGQALDSAKEQLHSLEADLSGVSATVAAKKESLEVLKKELEGVTVAVQGNEQASQTQKAALTVLQDEVGKLREQAEASRTHLHGVIESLVGEVLAGKAVDPSRFESLRAESLQVKEAETLLKAKEKEIAPVVQEMAKIEEQRVVLEGQLGEIRQEVTRGISELLGLLQKVDTLELQISEGRAHVADCQSSFDQSKKRVDGLTQEVKGTEKEIVSARREVTDAAEEVNQADKVFKVMETSFDQATLHVSQAQAAHQRAGEHRVQLEGPSGPRQNGLSIPGRGLGMGRQSGPQPSSDSHPVPGES